jgi:hypothetical protein
MMVETASGVREEMFRSAAANRIRNCSSIYCVKGGREGGREGRVSLED